MRRSVGQDLIPPELSFLIEESPGCTARNPIFKNLQVIELQPKL